MEMPRKCPNCTAMEITIVHDDRGVLLQCVKCHHGGGFHPDEQRAITAWLRQSQLSDCMVSCFLPLDGRLIYALGSEVNAEFARVRAGQKMAYPRRVAKHLYFSADKRPEDLVNLVWKEC